MLSGLWKLLSCWLIVFTSLRFQNRHKKELQLKELAKSQKEVMFKSRKGEFFTLNPFLQRKDYRFFFFFFKMSIGFCAQLWVTFQAWANVWWWVWGFFFCHLSSRQPVQPSYQLRLKLIHILIMSEFCFCLFLWDATEEGESFNPCKRLGSFDAEGLSFLSPSTQAPFDPRTHTHTHLIFNL